MFLLIDNRDSFSYNLYQYFRGLHAEITLVRADALTLDAIAAAEYEGIIISPGPGSPHDATLCLEVVRTLGATTPILGVCLGHQIIAEAYDGHVTRGAMPMHGRRSLVQHNGHALFEGIASPFSVGRYHSLVADPLRLPECLEVTAEAEDDGAVMAITHRSFPVWGVQFHPESIMTPDGKSILANFLRLAAKFRNGEPT